MSNLFFHSSESGDDEPEQNGVKNERSPKDDLPDEFRTVKENISFISFPDIVQSVSEKFWTKSFHDCIIKTDQKSDDMLFYVSVVKPVNEDLVVVEKPVFVRRIGASNCPPSNSKLVDWEKTHLLNTITRQLSFRVTVCVCHNESESVNAESKFIQRAFTKVFASPMKVTMRQETDKIEIGWPNLFFSVSDYEDVFSKIEVSKPGDFVVVDLAAEGNFFGITQKNISLFRGGMGFKRISTVYYAGTSSIARSIYSGFDFVLSSISRSKISLPEANPGVYYADIVGPNKRGKVEIAISSEHGKLVCRPSSISLQFEDTIETLFRRYETSFLQQNETK